MSLCLCGPSILLKALSFEHFQFIMLFSIGFFVYSASFTETENMFYNLFSNVPFPLSPKIFPSSLFTSTMFPCSLMDFGHVPLFLEPLNDPHNCIITVKCQNVVKCELYMYSRYQVC